MKKLVCLLFLSVIAFLILAGCKKKSETNDQVQAASDQVAAAAINSAFNEVFSQIGYAPKGNVDVTINSTAGGNAHVTGTITYSETTQRTDWFLSIGWWSYKVNGTSGSYTLNGLMACNGYSNVQGAFSSNYSSGGGITLKGTYSGIALDYKCSFNFKVQYLTDKLTTSGDFCGRSF